MSGEVEGVVRRAREQSIGDLLRRSARRLPNRTAIRCGDTVWSYAQLDALCNRLGRGLIGLGVAKGDRVAVLARNSHAFVAIRFAVARIGAVLVPINFMLNPEEIRFILASSGATILAVGPEFVETGRAAAATGCAVRGFVWLPAEEPSEPPADITTFDDLLDADASAPADSGRRPGSGADHLHQRHRIPAQGRDAHA